MRGNTVTIEMAEKRGKMAKTIPLYQFDYGQRLIIIVPEAELPTSYEVNFSNELHGEAVTMIGDSTGVDIPDTLLTTGLPVYLWLFLHDGEDDGETEYAGVIPVIKRAETIDDPPTPEQQSAITQAIAALNAAVEQTALDVAATGESVTVAETAQGKAEDAQEAAETAQGKAEDAQEAAETAQGKAEDAQEAAETAQGKADDAQEAAEAAQTAAETAETNAQKWATGGTSGTPSATNNAKYYSEQASDSATDAANSADAAAAAAEALIDDTAGDGDTDKVWSADKVHEELSAKADKADTVLNTTLSRGRKANTTAGTGSVAFGNDAIASGAYAAAFGNGIAAQGGNGSFAEGLNTSAIGDSSHAEGEYTTAGGVASHAENCTTTATGKYSHAQGQNTEATHRSQFVFGEYNVLDGSSELSSGRGNYVEIAGNGTGSSARSNARTLDWDGNETLAGDLTIFKGTANEKSVSDLYKKPATGIPASDLANGVIPDVSGFYTKPASGIPASDIADGVIPDPEDLIDDDAGEGDTDKVWSADKSAEAFSTLNGAINANVLEENLLRSEMPGTSTMVTMDSNGNPTSIVHTANSETVRTDTFVWGTDTVTETRTLANGKYITITTNLTTLAQTISAVQEVA